MKRIFLLTIALTMLLNGCAGQPVIQPAPLSTPLPAQLPCPTVVATATLASAGQTDSLDAASSVAGQASDPITLTVPSGPTPDATEIYRREQMLLGVNPAEPLDPITATGAITGPTGGTPTATPCP